MLESASNHLKKFFPEALLMHILISSMLAFVISTQVAAEALTLAQEDKTVFLINETPIKESTLQKYYQSKRFKVPANSQQQTAQKMKSTQELINIYLLSDEAEKNNLQNDYAVKQALELARKTVLMQAMVEKYADGIAVSDDEVDEAYALIQKNSLEKADFKIKNIIVDDKIKAEEIISQLKAGDNIEELEKKHFPEGFIKEQTTEWMSTSVVQPAIAKAIGPLKKGEFTQEPVNTKFGWHVIYIVDKKIIQVPLLDKIKPDITTLIKQKKLQEMVQQLRSKATIKTQLE
jgi:peptidyl-prolyl cis-trans isomerase C